MLRNPAMSVSKRLKAIDAPLIIGNTFCKAGMNNCPRTIPVSFTLFLNCLIILDGELIVFAKSPQDTFDWSSIAIILNCIFSACVISETDFDNPKLYA